MSVKLFFIRFSSCMLSNGDKASVLDISFNFSMK